MVLRTLWAILQRRESFGDLIERIGGPMTKNASIWIHAASVGEVNATKPAIIELSRTRNIIVTTITVSGRESVEGWKLENVSTGLAPFDSTWLTQRFLKRAQVVGLVIVENELWPNRILACQRHKVSVAMINARMSDGSLKTWKMFKSTAHRLFNGMQLIVPQDDQSARRFEALGAPLSIIQEPVNLKRFYRPKLDPVPSDLAGLKSQTVILAAATHIGEDEIVINAFNTVRAEIPEAKLIIAPRHPERGTKVSNIATIAGYTVSMRSKAEPINTDVYVADTLSEMHFWYQLCQCAFIGGSLVPKGGHTPFEPLAYGCQIIHGPHLENFTDAYQDLGERARLVTDAPSLAAAMLGILSTKKQTNSRPAELSYDAEKLFAALNRVFPPVD